MVDPWDKWVALWNDADAERCAICGGPLSYVHDHQPDNTGLDDGPYLKGCAPRKKAAPKPPEINTETRARAWATRRAKYGVHGHG